MSFSTVTVTFAADNSPADLASAEGNVVAVPSGAMWPDTNNVPVVPMVVHAQLVNGTCSVVLVASDNFASGVLKWDFIVNIRGLPTVNVPGVAVNFASGASQNGWAVLSAAGWTPTSQP